jgi:DNA-binding response OmpR family regulator
MTKIPEHSGHRVRATGEFEEAPAICRESLPDLILTNVFLRGVPGHEAMLKLKSEFPQTLVLMVSGLPDDEVIQEWTGETGFDVFPKPFTADSDDVDRSFRCDGDQRGAKRREAFSV